MKKFANKIGYSDIDPFEVISHTAKTITIREMETELALDWKPEIIPGGFSGHCVNQNTQKWIIKSNSSNITIKAHLRKDVYYWSLYGRHQLSDNPCKFYDYNF